MSSAENPSLVESSTTSLREYYATVASCLTSAWQTRVVQPISLIDTVYPQFLANCNSYFANIAAAVVERTQYPFDLVVYPQAGSDVLTPTRFADRFISLDMVDPFIVPTMEIAELAHKLELYATQKLGTGFQLHDMNTGFASYCYDLHLVGAMPETIKLSPATQVGGWKKQILTFRTVNGRTIQHISYSGKRMQGIDNSNADNVAFVSELKNDISTAQHPLALAKAGASKGSPGLSRSLLSMYHYHLPDGIDVLSDTDEQVNLQFAGQPGTLEPLTNELFQARLAEIQANYGKAPNCFNTLQFGYLKELQKLYLFKYHKTFNEDLQA